VWRMLRAFGFDNVAVLDGGWKKWTAEGRPVSTRPPTCSPAKFVADPRPELIAAKNDVIAAMGDSETCILNALDPEEYAGRGPVRYGRPGHIPSSVNVWCLNLVDPQTNAFLPPEKLREQFAAVGALDKKKVIVYCGGAIAATADAFVLTLLGADHIAVYDGCMTEWAADPALPLETAS
ncbi:MAG: rhodanese-like domain-containing protein, partial [Acidobacteria bacterium]|nr:rhodanese-like domain-containing protein [Acidobacteriota bacterium]